MLGNHHVFRSVVVSVVPSCVSVTGIALWYLLHLRLTLSSVHV